MNDIKLISFREFAFDGFKIPIITVYKNTKDYPDKLVARLFNVDVPTKFVVLGETIEELREKIPQGLIRFSKEIGDDESVIETWL